MKTLGLYIMSFIMVVGTFAGFEVYTAHEENIRINEAKEKIEDIEIVDRLHFETVEKINEYYNFKEYEAYTYEYSGNKPSKINYLTVSLIGSSFERSIDIIYADEKPTLEEIENEFEQFGEEYAFRRAYGKYLDEDSNVGDRQIISVRSLVIAAIIAFFPLIISSDNHY